METRLLIAGEQVAGEGPGLDVENPYTQTTLATVALLVFEFDRRADPDLVGR